MTVGSSVPRATRNSSRLAHRLCDDPHARTNGENLRAVGGIKTSRLRLRLQQ